MGDWQGWLGAQPSRHLLGPTHRIPCRSRKEAAAKEQAHADIDGVRGRSMVDGDRIGSIENVYADDPSRARPGAAAQVRDQRAGGTRTVLVRREELRLERHLVTDRNEEDP